jgi:hypothetical protein
MKQFLSQEKLEEIQEIIEMKIVHRYDHSCSNPSTLKGPPRLKGPPHQIRSALKMIHLNRPKLGHRRLDLKLFLCYSLLIFNGPSALKA